MIELDFSKAEVVSIHAPRVRCDILAIFFYRYSHEFQSTHLV